MIYSTFTVRRSLCRSVVCWAVAGVMPGLFFATSYIAFGQESEVDKMTPKPVPVASSTAKIDPANSRVEFVGLHTGRDPRPRLGGFKKFDGVLVVDEGKLKKISVEIEIASIWTEFDKLTRHLQAADFLNSAIAHDFRTAAGPLHYAATTGAVSVSNSSGLL